MNSERNPQAEQMGDASMVRNLGFQAAAIWPQEQPLFARYHLTGAIRIVDVGCGTGEISRRLATLYPEAQVIGLDILESNLAIARRDSAALTARIDYRLGDAFALELADNSVDLLVCRHVSQAVPDFALVLAEFTRVLRPGGWLHLLSEDYGMIHLPADHFDPDRFWNQHAVAYLASIGCDGRIGRHSPALLDRAGYRQIAADYLVIDTLRVARPTLAGVFRAWRDGYASVLAAASGRSATAVIADMDCMIAAIETPPNYALWQVPVISGQKPVA